MSVTRSQTFPPGFLFKGDFLSVAEAREYERTFAAMSFSVFSMRGHALRRQVRAFGMGFGMNFRSLRPAEPKPPFLLRLRDRAAPAPPTKAEKIEARARDECHL